MFSPKISHFWAENTFFLILFSRREWVGNTNRSIFPVPLVQLSPNFLHMVLTSLPTYPAKNFLFESPLVYFLVCALIKITFLVEIPSRTGRRELPIQRRGGGRVRDSTDQGQNKLHCTPNCCLLAPSNSHAQSPISGSINILFLGIADP